MTKKTESEKKEGVKLEKSTIKTMSFLGSFGDLAIIKSIVAKSISLVRSEVGIIEFQDYVHKFEAGLSNRSFGKYVSFQLCRYFTSDFNYVNNELINFTAVAVNGFIKEMFNNAPVKTVNNYISQIRIQYRSDDKRGKLVGSLDLNSAYCLGYKLLNGTLANDQKVEKLLPSLTKNLSTLILEGGEVEDKDSAIPLKIALIGMLLQDKFFV